MAVASEAELSAYLLPPGEIDGELDWERVFGRVGPVELEIGCGKGRFLRERSQAHPERCILGVDWGLPWLRRTARLLLKHEIENVRLMRTNAKHLLQSLVPKGTVDTLHVYFPDPWPKKRHHKRRLFDPATTAAMERVLRPGGQLHVATDYGEYFEIILGRIREHTSLRVLEGVSPAGGQNSNFAVKYLAQGRRLHGGVWEKTR